MPVAEETIPTRTEGPVPLTTVCSAQLVNELAQESVSESKVISPKMGSSGLVQAGSGPQKQQTRREPS